MRACVPGATVKFLVAFVVAAFVGSPLVAVAVAVMRASDETINSAIMLVAGGVFLVLVGVAVRIVLEGVASHRQAQFPQPSHQIDARRQTIDARRQSIGAPAASRAIEEVF